MNCKNLNDDITMSWVVDSTSDIIFITLCGCVLVSYSQGRPLVVKVSLKSHNRENRYIQWNLYYNAVTFGPTFFGCYIRGGCIAELHCILYILLGPIMFFDCYIRGGCIAELHCILYILLGPIMFFGCYIRGGCIAELHCILYILLGPIMWPL